MPDWFEYNNPARNRNLPPSTHRWKLKPSVSSRRAALVLSYLPDWALAIIVGGLFFVVGNISGFKREFSLTDTSIQHSYAVHERITFTEAALIVVLAPAVLMPLINYWTVRSFWDWHNSWLGLLCAASFTGTTTNIVKITVGRPRPDLIARCQIIPGSVDKLPFGLSTVDICTQTDKHILIDGWKSFFSGHSSISFAGMGFFSFWLMGKMHLFDKRGHSGKAWVAITPLVAAALVAISRTMDNRHHWQDVLIGSIVGLAFAYFTYRQYYPPLTDKLSHLPYRPRIDWDDEFEAIQGRSGTVRRKRTSRPSNLTGSDTLPFHFNPARDQSLVDMDDGPGLPLSAHSTHGMEPMGGSGSGRFQSSGPLKRPNMESDEDRSAESGDSLTREALEVDKTYPSPKKKATL